MTRIGERRNSPLRSSRSTAASSPILDLAEDRIGGPAFQAGSSVHAFLGSSHPEGQMSKRCHLRAFCIQKGTTRFFGYFMAVPSANTNTSTQTIIRSTVMTMPLLTVDHNVNMEQCGIGSKCTYHFRFRLELKY